MNNQPTNQPASQPIKSKACVLFASILCFVWTWFCGRSGLPAEGIGSCPKAFLKPPQDLGCRRLWAVPAVTVRNHYNTRDCIFLSVPHTRGSRSRRRTPPQWREVRPHEGHRRPGPSSPGRPLFGPRLRRPQLSVSSSRPHRRLLPPWGCASHRAGPPRAL